MSGREVTVSGHALEQARRRFRWAGPASRIAGLIEQDVIAALAAGRIGREKLPGFRLYGQGLHVALGHRFVWTEDEGRGYLIHREDSHDVVVTCLSRATSEAA